ncbi:MAG: hypothetical protein ACXW34_10850 [Nitrospira sp.]
MTAFVTAIDTPFSDLTVAPIPFAGPAFGITTRAIPGQPDPIATSGEICIAALLKGARHRSHLRRGAVIR